MESASIPFSQDPPECDFNNHLMNFDEKNFIDNKLKEYVSKSCISEVHVKPKCVTPL